MAIAALPGDILQHLLLALGGDHFVERGVIPSHSSRELTHILEALIRLSE